MILTARSLRAFAYGFLSVLLGIHLESLGLDPFAIGVVFTASLMGAAALTLALSAVADRWGRRRLLIANALLMAAAGLVFALASDFWLLLLAALSGTIGVSTNERGAFLSIEQAILPQTAPDHRRTQLFSVYNVVSSFAGAVGAMASGAPVLLQGALGSSPTDALRLMFYLYALLALAVVLLFVALTADVEVARATAGGGLWGVRRSARTVAKLAALFSLDSLGGGLVVQSFLAFWFHSVHGIPLDGLGQLFAAAWLIEAGSFLVAERLARRIGLINTMVFTHLPSNILLAVIPLAPMAWLAVLLFLLRQSLSQMDVPTRQSYLMAIVDPGERVAAAGITHVARVVTQSVSPAAAGYLMEYLSVGMPFFLAGMIKAGYDLALYFSFRSLRPPEEEAARAARSEGIPVERERSAP
ncbi:MAG: MFS transporter [Chloroflexi bacterium]|nr:MFS transporter [Chloroflexota bacterium]